MKEKNLHYLSIVVLLFILLNGCANQGAPTGGPRDSIPPTIINSVPINQSTDFKGKELYFLFDERITAEKLKQQLIITPNTDLKYSFVTKKEQLFIKLETPLLDSTTYNFNFLEGVTDITEKNPVVNFKLAFSTGPYIDSIYTRGVVKDLITAESVKDILVALYDVSDTTNVFEDKPKYFSTADESGIYAIENIKTGYYNIYAWADKNKNLKLETDSEAYAFLKDSINLFVSIDSLKLSVIGINTEEPKLLNARSTGRYFDVKYNKRLLDYKLIDSNTLANHYINNEKLIRFYNTKSLEENDSIVQIIQVADSLGQISLDTVSIKFRKTKKKPNDYLVSERKTEKMVKNKVTAKLTFNKPTLEILMDSVQIGLDTIAYINLSEITNTTKESDTVNSSKNFTWNTNHTQLDIQLPVDWKYINDSIRNTNLHYKLLDSLNTDSTKVKYNPIREDQFNLILKNGSIVSVEFDTLKEETLKYIKEDIEELGVFVIAINTSYQNFWIELIDTEKKEVIRTIRINDQEEITITRLPAATYKFVIKLDENDDGIWSYGNILEKSEPEKVIHPGLESVLRANYEVNLKLEF